MRDTPLILLTFDVEEFDLPLEYSLSISPDEQMRIGKLGLDKVDEMLQLEAITTTLFTTADFAQHYPEMIARLAATNEIASHAFYHSSFKKEDLLQSRLLLETISSKKVTGLRMPRLRKVDIDWVKEAGYLYDSSINPTYIPGRYNNRHLPRTVYTEKDVLRLPTSVTPNFRIPLFWLAFKNLPYILFRKMALQTLRKDGYLSLYFHPWEFTDISTWKLPAYVKRRSGEELTALLHRLIKDLKAEGGKFLTIHDFMLKKGLLTSSQSV